MKCLKYLIILVLFFPSIVLAAGISYEDETSYTSMRGSFVDGQSWWDGELLGSEAITVQNNRDFSSGTIGNWLVYASGSGTCTYSTAAIGGADNQQGLLTSNGDTYLYALLSTSQTEIQANTLYKFTAKVYVPAANTLKTITIGSSNLGAPYTVSYVLNSNIWTLVEIYYPIGTDVTGSWGLGFDGNPADGDLLYFDDISIKPVTSLYTQSFRGNLLIVDDGAGNLARGFIGMAGTGETLTALSNNITGITKANPGVVSSTTHGLSIGHMVYFSGLTEMTELNGTYKTVTAVGSANAFSINDTSAYGAAETTGGACGKKVTEPNATAVKIYKTRALVNEGWESIGSIDYNAGANFDFDVNRMPGVKAQQW